MTSLAAAHQPPKPKGRRVRFDRRPSFPPRPFLNPEVDRINSVASAFTEVAREFKDELGQLAPLHRFSPVRSEISWRNHDRTRKVELVWRLGYGKHGPTALVIELTSTSPKGVDLARLCYTAASDTWMLHTHADRATPFARLARQQTSIGRFQVSEKLPSWSSAMAAANAVAAIFLQLTRSSPCAP